MSELDRMEAALRHELGPRQMLVDLIQIGVDTEALMKTKGGQWLLHEVETRIADDLQRIISSVQTDQDVLTAVRSLRVNYGIMTMLAEAVSAGRQSADQLIHETADGQQTPIY